MPLGDVRILDDGKEVILTGKGWVESSPELEAAANLGIFEVAAANFAEMMSMGLIEAPEGTEEVSPVAAKAGQAAGMIGIASPALTGAQRMLQAVKGARGAAAGAEATTTGGGMFKTSQGFWKLPSDIVPKPLQGTTRALEAGLGAIPGGRVAIDLFNIQRRGILGTKAGDVLGVTRAEAKASGGRLRPQDVDGALNRIDDVYDSARGLVNDSVGLEKVAEIAGKAEAAGIITADDVIRLTNAADKSGDQLLELRSIARQLARSGTHLERRRANEIIGEIQDLIKDSAKGTEVFEQLAIADRRYKFWKTIDGSGVIDGEGWLNLASLKNNAARVFSTRTVRGGKRDKLRPVEQELMSAIDELSEINYRIPSSGTAERAIAAQTLGLAIGIPIVTH